MSDILTIKIAGPAGLGIKSAGLLLAEILLAHGFNLHDYSEYPSLIRGGHNTYQVSFSFAPFFSVLSSVDIFFSLAPNHHLQHLSEFHSDTLIFTPDNLPFDQSLPKSNNIICLGVISFILGLNQKICQQLVKASYPQFASANLKAFQLGFNHASAKFTDKKINLNLPRHCRGFPSKKLKNHQIYDGNQAFSWGFIRGGGDFYAAYPMTPSTGALHTLASLQKKHAITVVHPEDEIAAASMAVGAAFTGSRSAVGTAGGGFALMNETLSFCGVAEIGVVFYLASRPGPATGLPTWTGQSDLLYAVFAGHGDFPKIVLASSDQQDSYDLSLSALNLADCLQAPVILLSDKFIAESSTNLSDLSTAKTLVSTGPIFKKVPDNFRRYNWSTKSGVSPRCLPGTSGGEFVANSYEHDQFGFATEDQAVVTKMVQKRAKKLHTALKLCPPPIFLGSKTAKNLVISWGSTKGPILQALSKLKNKDDYALLHLRTLWPINPDLKLLIKPFKKIIVIENNQSGQLTQLLKSQFNFNPDRRILKFDGRPFFPEELILEFNK